MARITVVCGHYGTGKTNFALNLAAKTAAEGDSVTLVDLDVVNPYFCSNAYKAQMQTAGVRMITTNMAGTTLDVPSLSGSITSVFDEANGKAIFDIGGDDVGAKALGRFKAQLENAGYEMLYVINAYRNQIAQPQEAVELLREIEASCRIQATGLVNNSHLGEETCAQTILDAMDYAQQVSSLSGLPLLYTTAPQRLAPTLQAKVSALFPVDIIVSLPWNANP